MKSEMLGESRPGRARFCLCDAGPQSSHVSVHGLRRRQRQVDIRHRERFRGDLVCAGRARSSGAAIAYGHQQFASQSGNRIPTRAAASTRVNARPPGAERGNEVDRIPSAVARGVILRASPPSARDRRQGLQERLALRSRRQASHWSALTPQLVAREHQPTRDWSELRRHHLDAPEHGTDPRQELPHRERLGEIIVSADLEPNDAIYLLTFGGKQENWHGRFRPKRTTDLETIDPRQHHIEHHGLRLPVAARPGSLRCRSRRPLRDTLLCEVCRREHLAGTARRRRREWSATAVQMSLKPSAPQPPCPGCTPPQRDHQSVRGSPILTLEPLNRARRLSQISSRNRQKKGPPPPGEFGADVRCPQQIPTRS